jgi:acyl-CoA thioesterase-1
MSTSTKIIIVIVTVLVIGFGILMYSGVFSTNTTSPSIKTPAEQSVTGETFKIVAFGDSLTAGLGVAIADSYPSQLEKILNTDPVYTQYDKTFTIINMGVSGETTSGGVDRVDFILAQKPDLILLGLGANDMLRSTDPALVEKNLTTILDKITKTGTPVILLGMESTISNGFAYKRNFDALYPTLAKTYDLPLVPFFLEGVVLEPSLNISDGIHPNQAGYEKIISENIKPILTPTLKSIFE